MSQPEPINTVLARREGELEPLKKLSGHIFTNGAVLSCPKCGRSKDKTADEMAAYMKRWPKCCGIPAEVKVK